MKNKSEAKELTWILEKNVGEGNERVIKTKKKLKKQKNNSILTAI